MENLPIEDTAICSAPALIRIVDDLLDVVMTENAFLRIGNRETAALEEIVGRKLELANRYYALCKELNGLGPDSADRRILEDIRVTDRLRDLTVYLNENRRLLTARHSATSRRVSAVMEALNDRSEGLGTYGRQAEARPANEGARLSLVTGTSA